MLFSHTYLTLVSDCKNTENLETSKIGSFYSPIARLRNAIIQKNERKKPTTLQKNERIIVRSLHFYERMMAFRVA